MLARHVSDLSSPSSGAFLQAVLPRTKSANTACKKTLLMMDRWGPKHVELTYVNKIQSLENFVCLVGLHIYYKIIHGPYNINNKHFNHSCIYVGWSPGKQWGIRGNANVSWNTSVLVSIFTSITNSTSASLVVCIKEWLTDHVNLQ